MMTTWAIVKDQIDTDKMRWRYIDLGDRYVIKAFDDRFELECELYKSPSDTTDLDAFEADYKPNEKTLEPVRDNFGHLVTRQVASEYEQDYELRCFHFVTGTAGGLVANDVNGDAVNDITVSFYDDENAELVQGETESDEDFQTRLDADCVVTEIIFNPDYNYEMKAGEFRLLSDCTANAYFSIVGAPDIVNKPYIVNYNLKALKTTPVPFITDTSVATYLPNDSEYGEGLNALRLIVRHGAGQKIDLHISLEHYV